MFGVRLVDELTSEGDIPTPPPIGGLTDFGPSPGVGAVLAFEEPSSADCVSSVIEVADDWATACSLDVTLLVEGLD